MIRRLILADDLVPGASYLSCALCGECRLHLMTRHPIRLWLWDRLGWSWLIAGLHP